MHRLPEGLVGFFFVALVAVASFADDDPPAANPAASEFEDPPEAFVPRTPRSEAQEDRVTASALFADGRLAFQRQEYDAALRDYERAWRYDPTAIPVLREIVPLAFQLRRTSEAARYAVLAAEVDPRDPDLLKRLALHLTELEDYQRALDMYERSLAIDKNDKPTPASVFQHLEMGRLYFITEQFDKAAKHFAVVRDALAEPDRFGLDDESKKKVLDQPDRTYSLLAEAFLQSERYDEAVAMFKAANEAKPDPATFALQSARVVAQQDRVDEALEQLKRYLDANESSGGAEPYRLLDQLLRKKFAADEAQKRLLEQLTKRQKDDPDNAVLGYFLADQQLAAGDLTEAAKRYDASLKNQPALDGYQGLLEVYRRQGDADKLLDALGRAVLKTGTLEPLSDQVAEITNDDKLVDHVLAAARKRATAEPNQWPEGVMLGAALLAVADKRFDAADELFEQALRADEPADRQVLLTWGLEMLMAEQYARSATVFQRALAAKNSDEETANLYFYLAGALELADKTDEALAAAKRAAALKSDAPRFRARAPWILYHAERYEAAEAAYRDLLKELDSDHSSDEVRDVVREIRMTLSNICVVQGRIDEAVEWLEQVLDEFPEDIGAMNDLGYLWTDEGQHLHRALRMVQRAVAAEPDNIAYRDSLGWALFRLNRFDRAIDELKQAAAGDDPDGVILDHLGDAYAKAGQRDQAVATWKRAVEALQKENETEKATRIESKIQQHLSE